MKYLVILLDDAAPSFCHYRVRKTASRLMPKEELAAGIRYAMAENLTVQLVCPRDPLPAGYGALFERTDHSVIAPCGADIRADAVVCTGFDELETLAPGAVCILRVDREVFFADYARMIPVLRRISRLNVVLTDLEAFTEVDFDRYRAVLSDLSATVAGLIQEGADVQLNLLTDRLVLTGRNHCGAGHESITLAPDGRFYACPAFYQEGWEALGSLEDGLHIPNAQLYKVDHAPICRQCDAWQCRRCIGLNRRLTREVNTPSRQQCVTAHLERNASRSLQCSLREAGLPSGRPIPEIGYLDPFDIVNQWK